MWVFLVNQFIERFSANSFVCLRSDLLIRIALFFGFLYV
jgi:hypothetical protein